MRYLAIDLGDKRTGFAAGDDVVGLVQPLSVVEAHTRPLQLRAAHAVHKGRLSGALARQGEGCRVAARQPQRRLHGRRRGAVQRRAHLWRQAPGVRARARAPQPLT
jgi:hypothetical protein